MKQILKWQETSSFKPLFVRKMRERTAQRMRLTDSEVNLLADQIAAWLNDNAEQGSELSFTFTQYEDTPRKVEVVVEEADVKRHGFGTEAQWNQLGSFQVALDIEKLN